MLTDYGWRYPQREKPGMCPRANHHVQWPNLGWGKKWKEHDSRGKDLCQRII